MKEIKRITHLNATVAMPGSKSYTQRALVIAALAEGRSFLRNCLISEDTGFLIDALRAFGAQILVADDDIIVSGTGGALTTPGEPIYLGNNGTAFRFLMTMAALGRGVSILDGNERLRQRPMGTLLKALKAAGVDCGSLHNDGCPPVEVKGGGIEGGRIVIENPESSQYISSILISAPYAADDVTLALKGSAVSKPYIDITTDVMGHFGVKVLSLSNSDYFIRARQKYRGTRYRVEGDVSSASYFFLAAAILKGKVRVTNIHHGTKQGDIGFLSILETLGCRVEKGVDWIDVQGRNLAAGDFQFDMGGMPDLVPTVALLAAFRPGCTRISRVPHLRFKESDRIEATVCELRKIGARAEERDDGMVIWGGDLRGAEIETYNDHRIAMSFAAAGLAVQGMKIKNEGTVAKSFPTFWDVMEELSL